MAQSFDNIERYLESFGKYVVKQARTNLTKARKNVSKDLYNSVKFKLQQEGSNYNVEFYMLDYGTFVDKGVSGNKKIQEFTTYDGRRVESPFKYTSKGPPVDILSKWIKARGIKPKGIQRGRSKKTGQFISGLAYFISAKIKRDGIKSTSFFQRPLGLGMDRFGVGLLGAIKEDVTTAFSDMYKTTV